MTQAFASVATARLSAAWSQCQKHLYHLDHALQALQPYLPVTVAALTKQSDEQVQIWDQFILRFTKLQDTLGTRFYPALLDFLQEPSSTQAMLDKLNRLEQLGFLDKASDWSVLRAIRNQFAHDYPQDEQLKAAYLNEAIASVALLRYAMERANLFMVKNDLLGWVDSSDSKPK
jgi:phytoene dehydrogenase-like protein